METPLTTSEILEKPEKKTAYEVTKAWKAANREKYNAQARRYYVRTCETRQSKITYKTECHRFCMIDLHTEPHTHKELMKQYYKANKERISEQHKQKMTCGCGSEIRISDKSQHAKSKKHIQYLESL